MIRDIEVMTSFQFTMQQAVLHHYPEALVRYRFNNRSEGMKFNRKCLEVFKESVACKSVYTADPFQGLEMVTFAQKFSDG